MNEGAPRTGHAMRPITETISLDDALAMILETAAPIVRTERIALGSADGRVLAAAVTAPTDVPPFDRAAMDGFAVRAEDTFGAGRHEPKTLRVVETLFTGQTPRMRIAAGTAAQIATGAPMPDGADAVVMVEETERGEAGEVRVFTPVYPRQHVGRRGADIAAGSVVLQAGDLLTPGRVGALAALGALDAEVYAKPRVAILSTGDEIVEPGQPLAPGQIYDINRFTLVAIVAAHGGVPVLLPPAPDTLEALSATVDDARNEDALVFSGGSSVGERDLILDVLAARGEVLFHGVAVKPGKPTVFGRIGTLPVVGMPGYPTSCLSNGYMLLVPMLRRMARLPEHRPRTVTVPLARRVVSTTGRHQFYTVRISGGAATPAFKASGDITSMAHADGYIEIPAHVDIVEAGQLVEVKLF
jgi:molybdenum cofactor synthesis domain-containing protein